MKFTFKTTKFACYLGYITQAVVNNFSPLLFVMFSEQFSLSITKIASLITINFVSQMFVDLFGARYVEKIGYRRVLIGGQVFAAAGLIFLGVLPFIMNPYIGLIIATIVCAVGSGLTEVMVSPVIEALPGDAKSESMSFLHSFYCWGSMYTVLVATLFFRIFSLDNWRYLSFYWAILPIITAFLFAKVPINVFGGEEEERTSFLSMAKSGMFWIFVILMLCSGAAELAMSQWASMFVETSLGISKQIGDILGPCMFAVFMGIARVGYGKFGEKMNLQKSLCITSLICICGYLTASVIPAPLVNLAGCAICGFSVGIMWPGSLSLAANAFPQGGTALFGLLALAGDIGCTAGPELVANISAFSTLKTGLFFAMVFPITMIILSLILKKKMAK